MVRKIKLTFFLIAILFASIAIGETGKYCGKAWFDLPNGSIVQDGKIYQIINQGAGQPSKIQVKDFNGKLINEFLAPREIDNTLIYTGAGNNLIYSSKGKLYHLDLANHHEQEIRVKSSDVAPCGSDGSTLLKSCGDNEGKTVYDLKSQKQINITEVNRAQVNGQTVVYPEATDSSNPFSKVSVYDFSNSRTVGFDLPPSKNIIFANEKHIIINTAEPEKDGDIHLVNIDGKWVQFKNTSEKGITGVLSNGDLMFAEVSQKSKSADPSSKTSQSSFGDRVFSTGIYDKTGTQKKYSIDGMYMQNGNGILKVNSPMDMTSIPEKAFIDIVNGKNPNPKPFPSNITMLSKTGSWGLQVDQAKLESNLVNLNTGEIFKLPYINWATIEESENGKNIAISGRFENIYIVDVATGKIRNFAAKQRTFFDQNFENWYQQQNEFTAIKDFCFPDIIKVISDDCGCLFKNADNEDVLKNQNLGDIKDITLASLCQSDVAFNKQQWDKITPPITKGELSHNQALLYLKRFQKNQGFDEKTHLPILAAILESDIIEKSPATVNETLKTLSISHPSLVKAIYNILKVEERMSKSISTDKAAVCKSPSELLQTKTFLQTLKLNAARPESKTTTEDWAKYKPFKEDFQKLPKEERDAIVDGIAESLSQNAGAHSELKGVFQSKLYYFAKKYALELVGDKAKKATDLTMVLRNGNSAPIILASGNLQNADHSTIEDSLDTETPYGFSYKVLDPVPVPQNAKIGEKFNKKISWSFEGEPVTADIKITALEPLKDIIPRNKSPNYTAIKKGGKMTGLMVVGSNATSENAADVDSFIAYYQNKGFNFKKAKQVETASFLRTSIQSGEVGYLIKEAHSDGDERNLFRAGKYGNLIEGILKKKDGTKEVIYLLAPDPAKKETKLISNQEFGSWLQARTKDQPLYYFNASCNSANKVLSEVAAAHSPNFIPFPSVSSVMFFRDSEKNGTRQALEAFREGKNYDEIRASLQKTDNYKKGEDHFLFPDEQQYDEQIRNLLQMNLDFEIAVKDKTGKLIQIDESIDH